MNSSALITTIASIPVLLYFREGPENPPSKSATSSRQDFCESLWHLMTNKERGIWSGSWGNVYKYSRFIRPKTLKKLEQMTLEMPAREQRQQQQRQTIMALRNKNTEPLKRDHDNKANGSHSHSSHVWTVVNESATDCPYF
jgi:hypothetical protein